MTALLVIASCLLMWDAVANTAYYIVGKRLTRAFLEVAKELEGRRKAELAKFKP